MCDSSTKSIQSTIRIAKLKNHNVLYCESYDTDNHVVSYPQFHLITYRIEFLAGIGLKFVFWHLVLHILSALNIY